MIMYVQSSGNLSLESVQRSRIAMVLDKDTFEEWDAKIDEGERPENPLDFRGYTEKVEALRVKTGLDEAVITGKATICGYPVVIGVCDGRFMMASMGHAVGEKITRAVERATEERLPVFYLPVPEAHVCRRESFP